MAVGEVLLMALARLVKYSVTPVVPFRSVMIPTAFKLTVLGEHTAAGLLICKFGAVGAISNAPKELLHVLCVPE